MSLWDRLSRLAKSEISHAAERVRETVDELRSGERATKRHADAEAAEAEVEAATSRRSAQGSRWPREIRQAYAALELPLGADRAEVKKAYRDLMRRYHPDKHQKDRDRERIANELTVRIRESYNLLNAWLKEREGP